jgi:type I restriction enzyme, S subunit
MADKWPVICLRELCDADRGITYGIVQPGSPQADGVPIIRADDVDDGRISTSDLMHVSPAVEARYLRSRIRGGEVLLTLVGAYFGKSAVTGKEHVGCNTARAVGVIPVLEDADFVSFALRSPACQAFINQRANTTAQPTLNLSDVASIPIPWPPQSPRQWVIEVLRALDDRIELCLRVNQTLQLIAQAVFKDWFVDFGPVQGKQGSCTPYLAPDIWQLFPNRLDSESKPEGWSVSRFGKFFRLERGLSYKGEFLTQDGVPMINLGCFQGRGRFDAAKIKPYGGEFRPRHKVKPGDLLLANTDMTQNRVILGSPHVISADDGSELIFRTMCTQREH